MSAEERLNTLLSETEDVAREDQIFLLDGVEMAMAAKKRGATKRNTSKLGQPTTAKGNPPVANLGTKLNKNYENAAEQISGSDNSHLYARLLSSSKDTTSIAENQANEQKFSLITPEMDADYLSAVERGDMATAQQMVMEAAKLAMPNTKVVDENGNALVGYYGDRMKARYKLSADIFFTLHSNYARLYIIA